MQEKVDAVFPVVKLEVVSESSIRAVIDSNLASQPADIFVEVSLDVLGVLVEGLWSGLELLAVRVGALDHEGTRQRLR